mmetsp:Transcript_24703/g.65280  ORF Transcript_24703/g.65280 Transcript_24703/m.65280 type:complete len:255 (+) Transcript_24703:1755-2519(+)
MISSVTIHSSRRFLSLSTSSVRIHAERAKRRLYSQLNKIAQTASMSLKKTFGVGLQSMLKPISCGIGHMSCSVSSGIVEMMKLPVDTKMVMKTNMDMIFPRMLLSASSRVRNKRSAVVSWTTIGRSFQSEQNSYQPTLPFLFTSYYMMSNFLSSLITRNSRTMARWNSTRGISWSLSMSLGDNTSPCRALRFTHNLWNTLWKKKSSIGCTIGTKRGPLNAPRTKDHIESSSSTFATSLALNRAEPREKGLAIAA